MITNTFEQIGLFIDRNLTLVLLIAIVVIIIKTVSLFLIFKKSNIVGWKAIIPVYDIWTLLDMLDIPLWMIFLVIVPFVNFIGIPVIFIIIGWNLGMACHKGKGFSLGLALLPIVFYPLLAFSNFNYEKPTEKIILETPNIKLETMTNTESKPVDDSISIQNNNQASINNDNNLSILDQIPIDDTVATMANDDAKQVEETVVEQPVDFSKMPLFGSEPVQSEEPTIANLLETQNATQNTNDIDSANLGIIEPNELPVAKIVEEQKQEPVLSTDNDFNFSSEVKPNETSMNSNDLFVDNNSVLHNPEPAFNNLDGSNPPTNKFFVQEEEKYTAKKDNNASSFNQITDPSLAADPTLIFQMGSTGSLLRDNNKEARNVPETPTRYCPRCHSKNKVDCPTCIICGYNFEN